MGEFFMDLLVEPLTWVAVSALAFVGLLIHFKVPKMATDALDARSDAIAKALEEATKLREEAQAILTSTQRQQREAEKETEEIIALAKAEAVRIRKETESLLAEYIERRTLMAENKIAQAEVQAINDVKKFAADTAVAATRKLLSERLSEEQGATLIDQNIDEIKTSLH